MIQARPLPDGLILRTARATDAAELAEFNASVHADDTLPGEALAEWTLELFEIPPPGFRAEDDVIVVEDTGSGRIVSSLCLIPQTWSYAGVPTSVGQPELVGTHPDFRRRGLIRAQFDAIHSRSGELGQLWQIIGGIPWYYRQFGYSYALDLPPSPVWRWGRKLPEPPDGVNLRPAGPGDIPFLALLDEAAAAPSRLGCLRGVDGMTYEVTRRPGALPTGRVFVIEQTSPAVPGAPAEPIGYAVYSPRLRGSRVQFWIMELLAGHSWLNPTAAVLCHLAAWGADHPGGPATGVILLLPDGHPARRCVSTHLDHPAGSTFGLYVRIPDVQQFLCAIAPALDGRLAASPAVGFCGELTIDLFTERFALRFDAGRIVAVERVAMRGEDSLDLRMPHEAFLHLLLGNRSLADVEATIADCEVCTDRGGLLGEVLFPRMMVTPWTMG